MTDSDSRPSVRDRPPVRSDAEPDRDDDRTDAQRAGRSDRRGDRDERTSDCSRSVPETVRSARERIDERAGAIRDDHLETALNRLESRRDLSTDEREALAGLAVALTDRLVEPAERGLEAAARADDEETARALLDLFGRD